MAPNHTSELNLDLGCIPRYLETSIDIRQPIVDLGNWKAERKGIDQLDGTSEYPLERT